MNPVELTEMERTFLTNLLRTVQVQAAAPDAAQTVAIVQSVAAKLQTSTPKEN